MGLQSAAQSLSDMPPNGSPNQRIIPHHARLCVSHTAQMQEKNLKNPRPSYQTFSQPQTVPFMVGSSGSYDCTLSSCARNALELQGFCTFNSIRYIVYPKQLYPIITPHLRQTSRTRPILPRSANTFEGCTAVVERQSELKDFCQTISWHCVIIIHIIRHPI